MNPRYKKHEENDTMAYPYQISSNQQLRENLKSKEVHEYIYIQNLQEILAHHEPQVKNSQIQIKKLKARGQAHG